MKLLKSVVGLELRLTTNSIVKGSMASLSQGNVVDPTFATAHQSV